MGEKGNSEARALQMIVGLGNPGGEHRSTYHNVGRMFVELLAERAGLSFRSHSSGRFAYAKKEGCPILVYPQTFMNESGPAVASAARFFRVTPEALLIVHDDADLALGRYQLAFDRGAAGHNGVRSVIGSLGTAAFSRLRIGIRDEKKDPAAGREKAGSFVLRPVSASSKALIEDAFAAAAEEASLREFFGVDREADRE